MKFKLDFHPLVRLDLVEASAWYERQERGVGSRLEAEAKDLFRRLSEEALLYTVRFFDNSAREPAEGPLRRIFSWPGMRSWCWASCTARGTPRKS